MIEIEKIKWLAKINDSSSFETKEENKLNSELKTTL